MVFIVSNSIVLLNLFKWHKYYEKLKLAWRKTYWRHSYNLPLIWENSMSIVTSKEEINDMISHFIKNVISHFIKNVTTMIYSNVIMQKWNSTKRKKKKKEKNNNWKQNKTFDYFSYWLTTFRKLSVMWMNIYEYSFTKASVIKFNFLISYKDFIRKKML